MRTVTVIATGTTPYAHTVQVGAHRLQSDVPASDGGQDAGPSPHEYLAAALASCTGITLQMYGKRKGWPLDGLQVSVDVTHDKGATQLHRQIVAPPALSPEQRDRLVAIANACPVHKTLVGTISVETLLK